MNTETLNYSSQMDGRPWWYVRAALLVTLMLLLAVLVAMFAPTPLRDWVFGGQQYLGLAGL